MDFLESSEFLSKCEKMHENLTEKPRWPLHEGFLLVIGSMPSLSKWVAFLADDYFQTISKEDAREAYYYITARDDVDLREELQLKANATVAKIDEVLWHLLSQLMPAITRAENTLNYRNRRTLGLAERFFGTVKRIEIEKFFRNLGDFDRNFIITRHFDTYGKLGDKCGLKILYREIEKIEDKISNAYITSFGDGKEDFYDFMHRPENYYYRLLPLLRSALLFEYGLMTALYGRDWQKELMDFLHKAELERKAHKEVLANAQLPKITDKTLATKASQTFKDAVIIFRREKEKDV